MNVRAKAGRIVAASAPAARAHGRLARIAPASRATVDMADGAERYAFALVERHVTRVLSADRKEQRAARLRCDRARLALVQAGGADEAKRIATALQTCGGAVLRTVERAHAESRAFAARAAVRFVAFAREHAAESTAALTLLASAACWFAVADMLRERILSTDPAAFGASASRKGDSGHVTRSAGELIKLATAAANTGRLDLLSGLQVEQQARDGAPTRLDPAVEARMAAAIARRQALNAAAEGTQAGDPEAEPEPERAFEAPEPPEPEPAAHAPPIVAPPWPFSEEARELEEAREHRRLELLREQAENAARHAGHLR
jgi:hypothetical protein